MTKIYNTITELDKRLVEQNKTAMAYWGTPKYLLLVDVNFAFTKSAMDNGIKPSLSEVKSIFKRNNKFRKKDIAFYGVDKKILLLSAYREAQAIKAIEEKKYPKAIDEISSIRQELLFNWQDLELGEEELLEEKYSNLVSKYGYIKDDWHNVFVD